MQTSEIMVRLAIAAGLCAVVGLERELRGQPAGLRTHTIVGIGAALFTVTGAYGFADLGRMSDPGRIAAQVASGVGFLGAGVILRHGLDVRGLTTAATLWLAAALGVAAGAGMGPAAAIATGLVVLVLLSNRFTRTVIERRLRKVLRVTYRVGSGALAYVMQELEEHARTMGKVRVEDKPDSDPPQRVVWIEVEVAPENLDGVMADLRDRDGVIDVAIDRVIAGPE